MSLNLFRPEALTVSLLDHLLSNNNQVVLVCSKHNVDEDVEDITVSYGRAFPSKNLKGLGYIVLTDSELEMDIKSIDSDKIEWL